MALDVNEIAEGMFGQFIEPDAIRWAATLQSECTEQDAARLVAMMSIAVSLKRLADAGAAK